MSCPNLAKLNAKINSKNMRIDDITAELLVLAYKTNSTKKSKNKYEALINEKRKLHREVIELRKTTIQLARKCK